MGSNDADAQLAHDLNGKLPHGMCAVYDYPGFIALHYAQFVGGSASNVMICASSDWEREGTLAVDVQTIDGRCLDGAEFQWPLDQRTPERFIELVTPIIEKFKPSEAV